MPMGRLCMIKGAGSKVEGSEREVDEALADEDKTEGRCPRIPVDPGRPTKRERDRRAQRYPLALSLLVPSLRSREGLLVSTS